MRKILVIGAGRSTYSLIKYLLDNAESENWKVKVGDISIELAQQKVGESSFGSAIRFNVTDELQCEREINEADIVVSMLPASMHVDVARACIRLGKPMVTASYVSDEMLKLNEQAIQAGVTILNEIGVDPGIDHLSAMKVLDDIKEKGGKLKCFESFTGGLVAPESDNNPWNYKISWNPRNVVLAGQGSAAQFKEQGTYKYIPYTKVFRRTEIIKIDGYGVFEGYANRDSLKYRDVYGLRGVPTIYRGTLRRKGFCKAWNVFVQLGATDDSYRIENSENMTYREFINLFLSYNPTDSVEIKLKQYLKIDQDDVDLWEKLVWLDIFSENIIPLKNATPAEILEHIIKDKWKLEADEKDMLVMRHKFIYELDGKTIEKHSFMVHIGTNKNQTAMANTVGLPVAIATRMILNNKITAPGVRIPIQPHIYNPILKELEAQGIKFTEQTVSEN
jgi:saccharopine dehydrogenase-like NADP-dependent oxidoreductase|tara:strand:- start:13608 stop:14951 length:1344 start_codon:yes stop_codon:yes gene_type:complete